MLCCSGAIISNLTHFIRQCLHPHARQPNLPQRVVEKLYKEASLQRKCNYLWQTSVTRSNSSTQYTYPSCAKTNRLNFFFLYSASQAPDVCCALGKKKKNPPHRQKLRCCCDAVSWDAYACSVGGRSAGQWPLLWSAGPHDRRAEPLFISAPGGSGGGSGSGGGGGGAVIPDLCAPLQRQNHRNYFQRQPEHAGEKFIHHRGEQKRAHALN